MQPQIALFSSERHILLSNLSPTRDRTWHYQVAPNRYLIARNEKILILTASREALKCRRSVEKRTEAFQKAAGTGNENAYCDTLDEALSA